MKTITYLRLSLLVPFLVWLICLVGYMLISASTGNDLTIAESATPANLVFLFFAFYIIGIIVWIFPYLLLALILFLSSFLSKAQVAMKVFALSPLAMTVLTLAALNLLTLSSTSGDAVFSSAADFQDFTNFNLLVAGITLLWGYLCVGIAYGLYRILQRVGFIKEDAISMPAPIHELA